MYSRGSPDTKQFLGGRRVPSAECFIIDGPPTPASTPAPDIVVLVGPGGLFFLPIMVTTSASSTKIARGRFVGHLRSGIDITRKRMHTITGSIARRRISDTSGAGAAIASASAA
jgi:hypothetical protein